MITIALVVVAALLAYANGANDVSKGVATLVGSGVSAYRRAIVWGAVWTGLGGGAASVLGGAMLTTFGQGILAPGVTPSLAAAGASLAGAGTWVLLATRWSLPVSTTHALIGAVVGSGIGAYGVAGVAWSGLAGKVALPLIVSPFAAFALTRLALVAIGPGMGRQDAGAECLCLDREVVLPIAWATPGTAAMTAPATWTLSAGSVTECRTARPEALRLSTDHFHWLTSGTVSFARGLNDTPKIVALALGALALAPGQEMPSLGPLFFCMTAGMVAGSLLAGHRVTRVLAEEVTPMDHREGLAANVVTTALVTTGALYGLPMSTTHVSSGGIVAVGVRRGSLHARTVREIGLAWLVTLPAAALIAAMAHALLRVVVP